MLRIDETEPGWYCFTALPKREHVAASILRKEAALESFCPRISYEKKTRRGVVRFVECLFPGYIFINADLQQEYRRIRATVGIRNVVSFGGRIPCLPASFIEELKSRFGLEELHEVASPILSVGQQVTITEGPFKDMNAIISGQIDSRNRVRLLLEFLGRQLEIHVDTDQLFLDSEAQPREQAWKRPS